ncbi:MAG: hypothetical protein AVDCRST_MAG39-411, partial [uncultured Sphingomonadaceae bacterium]
MWWEEHGRWEAEHRAAAARLRAVADL